MYMLINLASKAVLKEKDPDTRHLCCSKCTACEAFVKTIHLREALVCLAFTDNELKAVLWFWYLCCIAIEWNQWIVIFLFVFCVFVQCVLINLLDNSGVTVSFTCVLFGKWQRENSWRRVSGLKEAVDLNFIEFDLTFCTQTTVPNYKSALLI